jgi:hypothetical protein
MCVCVQEDMYMVCIDRSFFADAKELSDFIATLSAGNSNLRNVIAYNFSLTEPIPTLPAATAEAPQPALMLQYDYALPVHIKIPEAAAQAPTNAAVAASSAPSATS